MESYLKLMILLCIMLLWRHGSRLAETVVCCISLCPHWLFAHTIFTKGRLVIQGPDSCHEMLQALRIYLGWSSFTPHV